MTRSIQVLPGADLAKECLSVSIKDIEDGTGDKTVGAENPATIWLPRRHWLLRFLERLMLTVERPVNWLVGVPQLNPFYYTGQIAVFLLLLVSVTGLFLVLFFQVGFDASYLFVSRIEEQFLARIIRAVHRYASDLLILVSVLHAFRLFVMERFRGPRWLAWISGVVMVVLLWLAGVTGYWLVWDQRAQAITMVFADGLQLTLGVGTAFMATLIQWESTRQGWILLAIVLLGHLALSAIVGVFFWLHIKRLQRPKWLLDRYWLIGLSAVLLIVSAVMPVGMLPRAELTRPLEPFSIDLCYLFFLSPVFTPVVGVSGLALVVVAGALPWLPLSRGHSPHIRIDPAQCTGCTLCATDCPYKAITLMPRTDGKPHKFVAMAHPELCVACGICVGACPGHAITLGDLSMEALERAIETCLQEERARGRDVRVVLTCERHAAQDALRADTDTYVFALPCVGMVHPDLVGRLTRIGAHVHIVGCPPGDCANREGNLWVEQRLTGKRLPHLKREFANAPIGMLWLPPGEFKRAQRSLWSR